jgi:hypothetical protein
MKNTAQPHPPVTEPSGDHETGSTPGHALMQNVRRGHFELGIDAHPRSRVAAVFTALACTIWTETDARPLARHPSTQRNSAADARPHSAVDAHRVVSM